MQTVVEQLACQDALASQVKLRNDLIKKQSDETDAQANEILERVYSNLAEFISDVCCVVDPEIVVIGGGVSKAGDQLLSGIQRHMHKYLFHAIRELKFALATLGNDAGAYGAFKLILDATK